MSDPQPDHPTDSESPTASSRSARRTRRLAIAGGLGLALVVGAVAVGATVQGSRAGVSFTGTGPSAISCSTNGPTTTQTVTFSAQYSNYLTTLVTIKPWYLDQGEVRNPTTGGTLDPAASGWAPWALNFDRQWSDAKASQGYTSQVLQLTSATTTFTKTFTSTTPHVWRFKASLLSRSDTSFDQNPYFVVDCS